MSRITFLLPFRCDGAAPQRAAQLHNFLTSMPVLLPGVDCRFVVCEQTPDGRRFNKGAVLNAGFREVALTHDDVLCLHDIDLIPSPELCADYARALPPRTVRHLGATFPRYAGMKRFMGGVLMLRAGDFMRANGFPNDFEGWGGEDDVLGLRVRLLGLAVERGRGALIDLEAIDTHDAKMQQLRVYKSCGKKKCIKVRKHRRNGLLGDGLGTVGYALVTHATVGATTRLTIALAAETEHLEAARG